MRRSSGWGLVSCSCQSLPRRRRRAGVSLEACPQRGSRVVQSGLCRPEWNTKVCGHFGQWQPDVVVKDKDSALLEREPPEGALQLIAIVDAQDVVRLGL